MPQSRLTLAVLVGVCGWLFALPAGADPAASLPGALSEVRLPHGLRAALAALDDRVPADRSQFLLEFIRWMHQASGDPRSHEQQQRLSALLAHLEASPSDDDRQETLPLPLAPIVWTQTIFGGTVTEDRLVEAILRSPRASLLYCGLLSLPGETRAWLAAEPRLLADLTLRQAAALVVAGPALRVADGRVHVPGGEAADRVWEALVGASVGDPSAFVRALLAHGKGQLAYFYAAIGELSPLRARFALGLDSEDGDPLDSARRVYAIFERIAMQWEIEKRPFWRPAVDPAFLVRELRGDGEGRPRLPGTRRFWTAAFGTARASQRLTEGERADAAWLFDQVFRTRPDEQRRRYTLLLFASHTLDEITPANVQDALEAIRARGVYPALVTTLERLRVTEPALIARVARRAHTLSAINDQERAHRALAQFQGTFALLARAFERGATSPDRVAAAIASLADVELGAQGEYEGRLLRWLERHLRGSLGSTLPERPAIASACTVLYAGAPGTMDCDLLRLVAGPRSAEPRLVEWEGTRYRVDFAAAEAARLLAFVEPGTNPYLSTGSVLLDLADLIESHAEPEKMRVALDALAPVERAWRSGDGRTVGWRAPDLRSATDKVRAIATTGNAAGARRLVRDLRALSDELFASGVLQFVYAVAMGHPDRVIIPAAVAASRHDFRLDLRHPQRVGAWLLPSAATDPREGWRVRGSLLGLDVRLAEYSLTRVSSRPVPRKPTVHGEDRRLLTETVALVQPSALQDADHGAIVSAIRNGRARLASIRTGADAHALADEVRLSTTRRTLLAWVAAHDRDRLSAFLSPIELFWLGLEGSSVEARFDAWGAPGEPRLGCVCLRLPDRGPWESLAGRWHAGLLMSGFPDLNLRLAELLAELQMPGSMLGPVLASATRDFLDTVSRREPDDRRGLVEFLLALSTEQVERYLALLTTDGPLVPIGAATGAASEAARTGVHR